jgi:hypothetical protein
MRRHFWMVGLVAVVAAGLWTLPVRAEGDEPGDGDRLQRLERAVGDLARLVSRLTREVKELQQQNDRLMGELREARRERGAREGGERDAKRGEGSERQRDAARREGDGDRERAERAERRDGVAEGVVRDVSVEKLGDGRYRKIVLRVGRKNEAYYMGPPMEAKRNHHQAELHELAERLKAGMVVRIEWVSEGDRRWIRQLRVGKMGRREGDRDGERKRDGDGERKGGQKRDGDREREGERRRDGDKDRDADEPRRDRDKDRDGDKDREADAQRESRGKFVRLEEKKLGRLEHLAVLIRLDDQEEATAFFVPMHRRGDRWVRNADITELARKLRKGQRVEVTWRMTEGQRFIRRLDW